MALCGMSFGSAAFRHQTNWTIFILNKLSDWKEVFLRTASFLMTVVAVEVRDMKDCM
jgi:hypothetical protein